MAYAKASFDGVTFSHDSETHHSDEEPGWLARRTLWGAKMAGHGSPPYRIPLNLESRFSNRDPFPARSRLESRDSRMGEGHGVACPYKQSSLHLL